MQVKPEHEASYAEYVRINDDAYGAAVVKSSEAWADAMETAPARGEELKNVAGPLSFEVNRREGFGLTGFMYGCAVQGLAHFWIHGEALRVWHNAEYGAKAEKGVVNPAVLGIGGPTRADSSRG